MPAFSVRRFDIRTAVGEPRMNADWTDKNRIHPTPQQNKVLDPHSPAYSALIRGLLKTAGPKTAGAEGQCLDIGGTGNLQARNETRRAGRISGLRSVGRN